VDINTTSNHLALSNDKSRSSFSRPPRRTGDYDPQPRAQIVPPQGPVKSVHPF